MAKTKTIYTDAVLAFGAPDEFPGTFSGYAVTYGQPLISGDVVRAGAFDAGVAAFLERGALLSQHDWDKTPVGLFTDARSDEHGLWIEGVWHSTEDAQTSRTIARERLEAGKNVALSVGFLLNEFEPVDTRDKYGPVIVTNGTLLEVSMVGVGNDPNATLTRVHGLRDGRTFAEHSGSVLDAVREFVERARSLREMRGSDGRDLSAENQARLMELAESAEQYAAAVRELCRPVVPVQSEMVPLLLEIEHTLARVGGGA